MQAWQSKKFRSPDYLTKTRRLFKKVVRQGRSKVRGAKNNERQVADGRELVSAQYLKGEAVGDFSPGPPIACMNRRLPRSYVEPLRFTPRRIRRGTPVNAAEMVRRQCPARTLLEDFINSMLVS